MIGFIEAAPNMSLHASLVHQEKYLSPGHHNKREYSGVTTLKPFCLVPRSTLHSFFSITITIKRLFLLELSVTRGNSHPDVLLLERHYSHHLL